LLRLLVAYEAILEFLDDLDERTTYAGEGNSTQLHRALAEAVSLNTQLSDYYRYHPDKDDGGYLRAFVEVCRQDCASLPCYPAISQLVIREANRARVLALNHSAQRREDELRKWTEQEFMGCKCDNWFELSGAATASLTVHALLAIAADSLCVPSAIDKVQSTYFPWLSLTATMLDSYVDWFEDNANGDHSYIGYYPNIDVALRRIEELIKRSAREALGIRDGHRHAVILACMVAMYMSRDSACTTKRQTTTRRIVLAGGSLTKLLLPILRTWRTAYALRSA
jgi:tetraprenyl-beta-curcumene synthase